MQCVAGRLRQKGDCGLNAHVSPNGWPALVLNADFRPLSYYPLSLWCWQDAIKAVFLDRVNIIAHYDKAVHSPSVEIRLPSVVSLKTFVRPSTNPAFTRFNVFLRDRFACQYCGSDEDLTFDHLLPRSRGGHTTWSNVVTACANCNLRKGSKTPAEVRHAAEPDPVSAFGAPPASKRTHVPAQLSARKLARLSLLGYRTRSVSAKRRQSRQLDHPLLLLYSRWAYLIRTRVQVLNISG